MLSNYSLSFSASDGLITERAFAPLNEICFLEKRNSILNVGGPAMLAGRNQNSPGFFPLLSIYSHSWSENAVLAARCAGKKARGVVRDGQAV